MSGGFNLDYAEYGKVLNASLVFVSGTTSFVDTMMLNPRAPGQANLFFVVSLAFIVNA